MTKPSSRKDRLLEKKKPIVAICYDFDKTLSPDDMQAFTFIPSIGMEKQEFWRESNSLAEENHMDRNLAWMHLMLKKSDANNRSITREAFTALGKDVQLFKGVSSWFKHINELGEKLGVEVRHYVISSGLKEIIEGSSIAGNFERIYASTFLYSVDGIAIWPAQTVNYTNKTQYIFRIAKGFLDESDDSVNDSMPDEKLAIPYDNFIYIGDSDTDVPCMRVVTSKGGYSIGVYNPQTNKRGRVYQLFEDGRLSFFAPADYSKNSDLFKIVKGILESINAKENLKSKNKELKMLTEPYKLYKDVQRVFNEKPDGKKPTKKERAILAALKQLVEGDID